MTRDELSELLAACEDPDVAMALMEQFEQDELQEQASAQVRIREWHKQITAAMVAVVIQYQQPVTGSLLIGLLPVEVQQVVWKAVARHPDWTKNLAERVRAANKQIRAQLDAAEFTMPTALPIPDPDPPF